MTINILGIDYEAIYTTDNIDYCLTNKDGYCDDTIKKIVAENYESAEKNKDNKQNLSFQSKKVMRHEIIHAFLYESGLAENSDWANNEEIVDWIAIQFPKILKTFKEMECL